jgi:hypothetical protein
MLKFHSTEQDFTQTRCNCPTSPEQVMLGQDVPGQSGSEHLTLHTKTQRR